MIVVLFLNKDVYFFRHLGLYLCLTVLVSFNEESRLTQTGSGEVPSEQRRDPFPNLSCYFHSETVFCIPSASIEPTPHCPEETVRVERK